MYMSEIKVPNKSLSRDFWTKGSLEKSTELYKSIQQKITPILNLLALPWHSFYVSASTQKVMIKFNFYRSEQITIQLSGAVSIIIPSIVSSIHRLFVVF